MAVFNVAATPPERRGNYQGKDFSSSKEEYR